MAIMPEDGIMNLRDRLHRLIGRDAVWSADHEGAGGTALRVTSGSEVFYVKHGPLAQAEHLRLRWLRGRVPVPEVVAFEDAVLVLADVGAPSLETAAPADMGSVLGRTLRVLHELPVAECPFDGRLPVALERTCANVRDGLVDPDDFDDDHQGLTPEAIQERLPATRPPVDDLDEERLYYYRLLDELL
jgi:kanamycin kinase/aminoglycoside 3'-phosphotransferase-2